jgi:IS5 family transposase
MVKSHSLQRNLKKKNEKKLRKVRQTPKSGYYVKDERTKQFAYSFHAATDEKGFLLGTIVTPGNVHDSHLLQPLVEKLIEKVRSRLLSQPMQPIKHRRSRTFY